MWHSRLYTFFVFLISFTCCSSSLSEDFRFSTVSGHDGVPLNVVEAGNNKKQAILFIHGYSQSQLAFKPQLLSELAEAYHLVAFDLRGHGASGKPWSTEDYTDSKIWADDLAAVIEARGLKQPVIVSWSYGGYVVMDYIRHYGTENLKAINFIGTLAGLVKFDPSSQTEESKQFIKSILETSALSRSLDINENILASVESAKGLSTPNMTEDERRDAFAMQMMMPAYVRAAMMERTYKNLDLIEQLQMPILLTRGTRDFFMDGTASRKLEEALPAAKESVYEGSGHMPFYEHPKRFNEELNAFISSLSTAKKNQDL